MSPTTGDLLTSFINEMEQSNERYSMFIDMAGEAGFSNLAKIFRAVVAYEEARTNLFKNHMSHHAEEAHDYFVCPHCGLVFVPDAPPICPVDETPGPQFITIS